jgi:hypothetical protein
MLTAGIVGSVAGKQRDVFFHQTTAEGKYQ